VQFDSYAACTPADELRFRVFASNNGTVRGTTAALYCLPGISKKSLSTFDPCNQAHGSTIAIPGIRDRSEVDCWNVSRTIPVRGTDTGMAFIESPAYSSDGCPNHNFWIAPHPRAIAGRQRREPSKSAVLTVLCSNRVLLPAQRRVRQSGQDSRLSSCGAGRLQRQVDLSIR